MVSCRLAFAACAIFFVLDAPPQLAAAEDQVKSDTLLEVLKKKGILTEKEAQDIRSESAHAFDQQFRSKTGMPEWVTSLKFNGDFRGRFEQNNAEDVGYSDRNRYRFRVRMGLTAVIKDDFEVGIKLATGNPQFNPSGTLVGGSPITANQDMNSLESRKFIWIDSAYAKWNPIHTGDWNVSGTIGKMANPFPLSSMIFDADINPEGLGLQASYNLNDKHSIRTVGGFFVLDELNQSAPGLAGVAPSHDPFMIGGMASFESKWNARLESSVGLAAFTINSKDALSAKVQPFYNSGNTRDAATGLIAHNFNPIVGSAALVYKFHDVPLYAGAFPVKLSGEYMKNPAASAHNTGYRAGVVFGKAGKGGLWEVGYRYQRLEADAWFDALTDDDNGAYYATGNSQLAGTGKANGWFGGTNVKGHLMQATYSVTDYLNLSVTYYLNDLILSPIGKNSNAGHFMIDLMWKF